MEPIPPDPAEGKHDAPLYHNVGNETIKNDETDEKNGVFWTPLELETCVDALRCINDDRPTCGFWGTLFAYTASAFSGCIILFGGSWIDGAVSGALGFVVGLLCYISAKYPVYGRVFELSSSVMVAIAARALHNYTCFSSVVVSSIFMVLPGYSMAIAAMELAARSINIGTIRLVYAVVYAFVLAYGMQVGHSMYSVMDPGAPEDGQCAPSPISHWFFLPLFPLMTVSMGMAYGSSYRQYLTQTLCATVTYLPFYFLGKIIPEGQIVGCLAAFACGLYGNLALKITGEAPIVPVCVGITLLVPGSIGVRGAFAILHREDILHESFPIQMLTICLGLVAGLFSAAMIVYPSGKRRSLYISL
ncbi:hypothetical protein BC940DRAFT_230069 [Gongronella butleri]|nr:hypothetical protein BC940DRAFT_230069 [Gongronella butleri]